MTGGDRASKKQLEATRDEAVGELADAVLKVENLKAKIERLNARIEAETELPDKR